MDIELKNKLEKIQRRQVARLLDHISNKIYLPSEVRHDINRSFHFTVSDIIQAIDDDNDNKQKP